MTPNIKWIAHRGLWHPNRFRENLLPSVQDAFDAGFSVEVDVRAHGNFLVLSHDPPASRPPSHRFACWDDFLDLLAAAAPGCEAFINVKEPGTEARVAADLQARGLCGRTWLFDFGLCCADPAIALAAAPAARCLRRASDRQEREPEGDFWAGTWLDQWNGEWATAAVIEERKAHGPVFLVSPELHGRGVDLRWLKEWGVADGICTDMPHLFRDLLNGRQELYPEDPWWRA